MIEKMHLDEKTGWTESADLTMDLSGQVEGADMAMDMKMTMTSD